MWLMLCFNAHVYSSDCFDAYDSFGGGGKFLTGYGGGYIPIALKVAFGFQYCSPKKMG